MRNTSLIIFLCFLHFVIYSKTQNFNYVGGKEAKINEFPYQLSMEVDGKPKCGGSIISKYWVLTSAFCVDGLNETQVTFRAGTNKQLENGNIYAAQNIIIHNKYNKSINNFDYALVKVGRPFPLGYPGIDKVVITRDAVPDKTIANVSGWGVVTNDIRQRTNLLHYVEVPTVNRAICKGVYWNIELITLQKICAGYYKGGKDPCKGDRGGPLVANGILIGIVSTTFCGIRNRPAIYSDVANQLNWIINITK